MKDLVRPLSKKRRFRTPFESQHVKGSQTLVKLVWGHIYQILSKLWGKLIWKTFPLVICEILGVFFNTLTADARYPLQDCWNLLLPIQRQLSEKRKTFSESTSSFEYNEKKMIFIAIAFPKLQTVKDFVWQLSKKRRFRTPIESQHVKGPQTIVKCPW